MKGMGGEGSNTDFTLEGYESDLLRDNSGEDSHGIRVNPLVE